MEWVINNWEFILIIISALISIINGISKSFINLPPGLVRSLYLIVEVLSFIKSKDVPGLFKLPGHIARPHE